MNSFQEFLESKNYTNAILKNAILKDVIVTSKDELVIYIQLSEYIDARLLFTFTKELKAYYHNDHFSKIDIKFLHINKDNFSEVALNYFENTIFYLSDTISQIISFKEYQITFENNTYLVHIDKDSKWISEYFEIIKNTLKDIDIYPEVKYVVDEEIKPVSERVEQQVESKVERLKELKPVAPPVVEKKKINYINKPIEIALADIPVDQFSLHKYQNENGKNNFQVKGEVFSIEVRPIKDFYLVEMIIADSKDAVTVKSWVRKQSDLDFIKSIKKGDLVEVVGEASYDTFAKDIVITTKDIAVIKGSTKNIKKDKAKVKRVELHLHTKMSDMDGIGDVNDYVKRAIEYGHKAIAFTDHNGVYAFPDIYSAIKGKDIKPIYGVEFDLVDHNKFVVIANVKAEKDLVDDTYVVFDLETTGLSVIYDDIIEIGAVKIKGGQVIDKYQSFINPNRRLSEFIKNLTNITDEDLVNARMIDEVLPEFIEFIEDATLVAHNAAFDMKFITENAKKLNFEINNSYVDTLNLARYFYNDKIKTFNLKSLSRYFKVELENHHRADEDANATSKVWLKMLYELRDLGIKSNYDLENAISKEETFKHLFANHATVLVKNQAGYKDLFKLVSYALTKNFYNGPRTIKEELQMHRENLLIGSACSRGEVFDLALNNSEEELIEAIKFYDYIEVQPPSAYSHVMERIDENAYEIVTGTILKIINIAKRLDKTVVATGNVHYLDEDDDVYRKIFVRTPLVGGGIHPLIGAKEMPKQYFRTTDEMLNEFAFLPKDLAYEIVVTNTNKINDEIEYVQAFSKELYSLPNDAFAHIGISDVSEETKRLVYEALEKQYGSQPHQLIKERVEKELKSIIGNKFASIYYISYLLVKKSMEDGYIVGSRGSVGSSLVATLLGITEVNPLKPHYYCKNGHFTAFELSNDEVYQYGMGEHEKNFQSHFKGIQSGYDLKDEVCPVCGDKLAKDGHDIPFETFLGFKGDKVPDIDLNFSGEYQAIAHEYVRELIGSDHSYRAGTISKVADRVAYGYVKGYLDDNNLHFRNAKVNVIIDKILGVKRSTGQHPGGIVVVPKDKSIYDVTPIQYPANDTTSPWYTTHFDYKSFEDNLLKLDVLGHDDPTVVKFIMDKVLENPNKYPFNDAHDIPLSDPNVLKMFSETNIINVKEEDIMSTVASLGIPEFGTPFTREMLSDIKPTSFSSLVKISGLSHGTDVWLGNSRDLIMGETEFKKVDFNDIIACRDDILVQLLSMGLKEADAFEIMEFVRKGKPSRDPVKWNDYVDLMEKYDVPDWYIWSASKIKYMFPKAHAVAYVIMALRIAWFKYYDPLLFYSAFFSKKSGQFDYEVMIAGTNAIRNKVRQLEELKPFERKQKDNDLLVTLGVALEMTLRGFTFLPVDINKSKASEFVIEETGLRMPFVTIEGLGEQAALRIVEERETKEFTSIKDVVDRTRINKNVLEFLKDYGSFGKLPEADKKITEGLFADL